MNTTIHYPIMNVTTIYTHQSIYSNKSYDLLGLYMALPFIIVISITIASYIIHNKRCFRKTVAPISIKAPNSNIHKLRKSTSIV